MNRTETINGNHLVKRLVWSCVLIAGLLVGVVPQANAHDPAYRKAAHYDRHISYDHRRSQPRWLRRDIAFQRWYWHHGNDRVRRYRHLSWNRVYDLYMRDRYYHKKYKKRYRQWRRGGKYHYNHRGYKQHRHHGHH